MEDISMIPGTSDRWVMMYLCGASETRDLNGISWPAFDPRFIEGVCHHVT